MLREMVQEFHVVVTARLTDIVYSTLIWFVMWRMLLIIRTFQNRPVSTEIYHHLSTRANEQAKKNTSLQVNTNALGPWFKNFNCIFNTPAIIIGAYSKLGNGSPFAILALSGYQVLVNSEADVEFLCNSKDEESHSMKQ